MSSDLKVLVGDLYTKADIACLFRGSRKFRDDSRERKVKVPRKFYVTTHVVKISVFRKSRVKFPERSAMVTTKENASSIGRGPYPGTREL